MAHIKITIDISPALAELASRQAWREGLGWREWISREAERRLADLPERVCWPAERERVSYL